MLETRPVADFSKYAQYYEQTVARCVKCNPKGFILVKGGYTACSCHTAYLRLKQLHDSGLPKVYWDQHLEDFAGHQAAAATVSEYIKNFTNNLHKGIGLYLYGNPGVGKTLLSAYILKAGLAKGKRCNFYYFNDVLSTFTEAWRDNAAREEIERNIINSDLLVLDDLGREYKSNKKLHESILDTVIRSRANNLRPIIITSNFDMYDVKDAYGSVIIDLFKESLVPVQILGDSYRKTKMDEKNK